MLTILVWSLRHSHMGQGLQQYPFLAAQCRHLSILREDLQRPEAILVTEFKEAVTESEQLQGIRL